MATKNRLYPHMMPEEIPIWERYLEANPDKFERLEYDVRVGTVISVPEDLPENLKYDAQWLSLKRIDAVGFRMGRPTILEVKKIIGFTAIGQAIGYPVLYAQTFNLSELPDVILIGEQIDRDMPIVLEMLEISYQIV